jgi:predicted metalloprotease with PDZ domain
MRFQNRSKRIFPLALVFVISLIANTLSTSHAIAETPAGDLKITLDATDIDRKLIHSTVTVSSIDGPLSVLYPKWIPGHHGPTGPIKNLAGFKVTDSSGAPILWERDYTEPFRFNIDASAGRHPIHIALTYICNPSSSDCSATSTLGLINWCAVSVYPDGAVVRDLNVTTRLILPADWKYATAMPVREELADTVVFETVTYEELLDYPVICGLYLKTIQLESTPAADYFVHVAVDEEVLLPLVDSAFTDSGWNRLAPETEALFGRTHFDAYHYLIPISDSIPHYGLEHRNSSVNSGGVKTLKEYGKTHFFLQWVMPHEFVHAWCGKYRRPDGMSTPDYQIPKNMELLWVYEGLTSYYGNILTARSGLVKRDYFMEDLADYWGNLRHKTGRDWRSLRDIAVSTYTVWGGTENWQFLRRAADYYSEGAMLWLEIDARIRESTNGKRSLDDFCKSFFGNGDKDAHSIPFDQNDLVSALSELADYNWDSLITVRISGVSETLDETPLTVAGYQFAFTNKKPEAVSNSESSDECHYYYESIGFAVAEEDSKILQIVPKSPGDAAGLCTGMTILGVNGKTFSFDRLDKAITDAVNTGELALLTQHGEVLKEYTINYGEGLRYISLQSIEDRKNWLDEIISPVIKQ